MSDISLLDDQFVFWSPGGNVYYGRRDEGGLPGIYDQVVYVPRAPAISQPRLTLADSWANATGVYCFLGAPLDDPARFAGQVALLLADPSLARARALWVANPNWPLSEWRFTALRAGAGGGIDPAVAFELNNYGVVVAPGCVLQADSDAIALRIQPPAGQRAIFLTAHAGASVLPIVDGDLTIALSGPGAGCLGFGLTIHRGRSGAGQPPADIDALDIGLRLFYRDSDDAESPFIASQRYPIFDTATTDITLSATIDPLAPLNSARSFLAFAAAGAPIPTFYRTTLGHPIGLQPDGTTSRLVFAARPLADTASARDGLYLVPDGRFTIAAPPPATAAAPPARLLCGTFGAEYIELASAPAVMTFVAGLPAYAPSFRPGVDVADDAPPESPRLTGPATTAWATVSSTADALYYYAQPHGAILHRDDSSPAATGLQYYFPVRAATLRPTISADATRAAAFPIVPYAGIQAADLGLFSRLESQIVGQQRRRSIYNADQPAGPAPGVVVTAPPARQRLLSIEDATPVDPYLAAGAVTAVTPQGLLALFADDHSTWKSLRIAQMAGQYMDFQLLAGAGAKDPLRAALLTNQQFLVISNAEAFRAYFAQHNTIAIEGWQFLLDPAMWARHGTILVVKNCEKSLREMAADTRSWVLSSEFNITALGTQQRLQQIIADADAQAHPADGSAPNPDYQHFADTVVSDPHWNGILFLSCHVPPAGLPPDLAGLAAGIDERRFFAHHLGINQTPVIKGQPQDSSLFGLIAYPPGAVADQLANDSTAHYDFQVLSLKALFYNSVIASFSARLAVTINSLFSAPACQPDSATGSALILNGSYQQTGAGRTLVFGANDRHVFAIDDATLAQVTIQQAQFTTVLNATGEQAADTILARITFRGALAFTQLELPNTGAVQLPYDIFSYDALAFADLRLDLSFKRSQPASRVFSFDASHMTFDPSQSSARDTGLARHFPLKLSRMLVGTADKLPTSQGYMRVSTPLQVQQLGTPWYGLVFELNLGTLGALAASAGFTANLALAWSPGQKTRQLFVGLKLPFSSGGKNQISLLGLLKIGIYSISLVYNEGAFLLKLNGISLKFMSKTLPPGASFDFFVFGDPDPNASSDSLGWYGAYAKDQPPRAPAVGPKPGPGQPPALPPGGKPKV